MHIIHQERCAKENHDAIHSPDGVLHTELTEPLLFGSFQRAGMATKART